MAAQTGKYDRLHAHLKAASDDHVQMTFGQIEEVLGSPLPNSARTYQAWWANQPRSQSLAWLKAGFRTVAVSVDEERLTFERLGLQAGVEEQGERPRQRLTIAEAKEGLAEALGIQLSQIEIIIKA